jgi:hypothetical protein
MTAMAPDSVLMLVKDKPAFLGCLGLAFFLPFTSSLLKPLICLVLVTLTFFDKSEIPGLTPSDL